MKKIFILSLFVSILLFLPTSAENVNQENFEVIEPVTENTTTNNNGNENINNDDDEEDVDYNDFLDSDIEDTDDSNAIILDTHRDLKPNIKNPSKIKESKIQLEKKDDYNISSQILNPDDNNPYEKKTAKFTNEKNLEISLWEQVMIVALLQMI